MAVNGQTEILVRSTVKMNIFVAINDQNRPVKVITSAHVQKKFMVAVNGQTGKLGWSRSRPRIMAACTGDMELPPLASCVSAWYNTLVQIYSTCVVQCMNYIHVAMLIHVQSQWPWTVSLSLQVGVYQY